VKPSIFSVIIAVFPYLRIKCVSVHMHRAEKATTARFIGQSRTAGPQCKTPFMSALWGLEFGGGSYIVWRICTSVQSIKPNHHTPS